jgi:hypothetical protein
LRFLATLKLTRPDAVFNKHLNVAILFQPFAGFNLTMVLEAAAFHNLPEDAPRQKMRATADLGSII